METGIKKPVKEHFLNVAQGWSLSAILLIAPTHPVLRDTGASLHNGIEPGLAVGR